jgi:hypothetical protein
MSTLLEQQRQLLHALWQPRHADAAASLTGAQWGDSAQLLRGLQAYRSNAAMLAQRVLRAAYPTVARLLGHEDFAGLARMLWRQHPPQRGDLAQWGEPLAQALRALPGLMEDQPWLADVARVEWALHCAATEKDRIRDDASFVLLQQAPAQATLVLSPSLRCFACAWAVADLVVSAQARPTSVPQTALVWRDGLQPRVRPALPDEPTLLAALQQGRPLEEALARSPGIDIAEWLPMAVQTGLVLGARLAQEPKEPVHVPA